MANRSCHPGATSQIGRAIAVAALQIALAVPATAQTARPASPETSPDAQGDGERKWFVMEDRPSLRLGDALRLDLTSKIGLTVRAAPDQDTDAEMEQRRIGVDGRLFDVASAGPRTPWETSCTPA